MFEHLFENVDQSQDRFKEILHNKTILLTGGTGFIGKVFMQKILRTINVKRIFLVIRPESGKTPEEKLSEAFETPVFNLLKEQKGKAIINKIQPIRGDLSQPDLDLLPKDRRMVIEETEIIVHAAATTRFDDDLKTAVLFNARGTKLLVELAKECKNLAIFCHISTAFCHLKEHILYEKTYDPPFDPETIISMCETLDNDILNALTPRLLKDLPNTYVLSKALAEGVVNEALQDIPAIILRPSFVSPVWKDPIPGWFQSLNGPIGLLVAAGKGACRTMHCQPDNYIDLVPADVVANAIVCCICSFFLTKRRVYNITSSAEYKITFKEIAEVARRVVETKLPLNAMLWYPNGSMKRSKALHWIAFFLFQWIPAVLVDFVFVVVGYYPFLKRLQRKLLRACVMFEYFFNTQKEFNNEQFLAIEDLMTRAEKKVYCVVPKGLNYEEYVHDCVLSARRYVLKESDDTIPAAKLQLKVMWWVDKTFKTFIVLGCFYMMSRIFK